MQANAGELAPLDPAQEPTGLLEYSEVSTWPDAPDEVMHVGMYASGDDGPPLDGPVLELSDVVEFSGERGDHIEVEHDTSLALSEGTFALTFTADQVDEKQALFSKDASGFVNGGHLSAFVHDGRLEVRLQSTEQSVWLKTASGSIAAGEEHHVAVTFGPDGFWVFLDGRMAAWNTEFTQGLENNSENLAIGASAWNRSECDPTRTDDNFHGTIAGFTVYDTQYDEYQIAFLAGTDE